MKQYVVPSSLLSPDEKVIVGFLKKKDAKKSPINQKEIGRELGWSKSKVSAVLSNLYYKKIIDREKFGRNYKVKLVKDVQ
jgi:predicted transcriptional regulator